MKITTSEAIQWVCKSELSDSDARNANLLIASVYEGQQLDEVMIFIRKIEGLSRQLKSKQVQLKDNAEAYSYRDEAQQVVELGDEVIIGLAPVSQHG